MIQERFLKGGGDKIREGLLTPPQKKEKKREKSLDFIVNVTESQTQSALLTRKIAVAVGREWTEMATLRNKENWYFNNFTSLFFIKGNILQMKK